MNLIGTPNYLNHVTAFRHLIHELRLSLLAGDLYAQFFLLFDFSVVRLMLELLFQLLLATFAFLIGCRSFGSTNDITPLFRL